MNNDVIRVQHKGDCSWFVTSVSHSPLEGNVSSNDKCTILRLSSSLVSCSVIAARNGYHTYTAIKKKGLTNCKKLHLAEM